MNTCDTCQHWGAVAYHRSYGKKLRCEHIVDGEGPAVPSARVAPIHDSNYLSELYTGPKFGCIHHKPK